MLLLSLVLVNGQTKLRQGWNIAAIQTTNYELGSGTVIVACGEEIGINILEIS